MALRTLLALAFLCLTAAAQEYSDIELRLSEIENRLAFVEEADCAPRTPCEPAGFYYAEFQAMWMQLDTWADERFKFAPRVVIGYEDGIGARARYWTYDYLLPRRGSNGAQAYYDFDVVDFEATTRLRVRDTDVLVSGGLRVASIGLANYQAGTDTDQFGLTVAADGRTKLLSEVSFVYGGRISLLRGDWESYLKSTYNNSSLAYGGFENYGADHFFVPEIYTGLEYSHGNLYARFVYEVQRWSSDALEEFFRPIDFIGFGGHIGVRF